MQKILSLLRRCVEDYDMIAPGERVAVGVSGGKDSLVQLLFLSSGYLSFYFQILKHDHIRMVFFCISCDCSCNLSSEFCVKALRISPPAFHLCRAMLALESAYPSQYTVHPVFFTGKINKPSSQDSSI